MSVTLATIKALLPAARLGYREIGQEVGRRLAAAPADNALHTLSRELEAAVAVLARDAPSALGTLEAALRGLVSRPDIFAHDIVQTWIRTDGAQTALKQAALALIRGEEDTAGMADAVRLYTAMATRDDDPGAEEVIAAALDYLQVALRARMSVGERVLLNAAAGNSDKLDRIAADLASFADTLDASHTQIPTDLIDVHLDAEVRRLKRSRFFQTADIRTHAPRLVEQVVAGQFAGASAPSRARALAWCARWVSQDDSDAAHTWLARARLLAEIPETKIASAFVLAASDWQAGLGLLDARDSPLEATAVLQILRFGCGSTAKALDRIDAAGLSERDLDADGRFVLLAMLAESGLFERAVAMIATLNETSYEEAPALLALAGGILTAASLAPDLRLPVLSGIPFDPANFPLPDDAEARRGRRLAAGLMAQSALVCRQLGFADEALAAERYGTWLELRDPETKAEALDRLKAKLRIPAESVSYLHLALAFQVPVDRAAAGRQIDSILALKPQGDADAAMARLALALALMPESPREAAEEIARHRGLISQYLEPAAVIAIEIELKAKGGDLDAARALLGGEQARAILPAHRQFLIALIDQGGDAPTIETLEALFAKDESTRTLDMLVNRYGRQGYSERYLVLVRQLIGRKRSVEDVEDALRILVAAGREAEAELLLGEVSELVDASLQLIGHKAWIDYRAGRVGAAEAGLDRLEARRDDANDRALRVNLLVATGRWGELNRFLEEEWAKRSSRAAPELIQLGSLALALGSERTREILLAAVDKRPEDANILASAYFVATSAGIEDDEKAFRSLLPRAAALSGADGPIQATSMEDLIARQPDWERRVADVERQLVAGAIPVSVAAAALNRPWLEMTLLPMLTNQDQRDARRRVLVPLYSGARQVPPVAIDTLASPDMLGLDRTALITLAAIGHLDTVLGAFPRLKIPHDTLSSLFEERRRTAFHQPSRIVFARSLMDLLAKGVVKPFVVSVRPVAGLVDEVGTVLAELLASAASAPSGQHVVIHPYPISRVGSLMHETADLGANAVLLRSCSAIVDRLEQDGHLTRGESRHARGYLDHHDRRWPDEPGIADGATLYLSDLAVDYLRHAGILDKIGKAGLTVLVSHHEIEEAHALIDHARFSDTLAGHVEMVRRAVSDGIASGHIILDAALAEEGGRGDAMVGTGALAMSVPALVCDDRFINRYTSFDHATTSAQIFTTRDLLDWLRDRGILSTDALREAYTRLRRMGAVLLPVTPTELLEYLAEVRVAPDGLHETAELRAIRENVRLVQQRCWWQPDLEMPWLTAFQDALTAALIGSWHDDVEDEMSRWRSFWLLRLADTRGWAGSATGNAQEDFTGQAFALTVSKLTLAARGLEGNAAERFLTWFEQDVVNALREEEPALYRWLIAELGRSALAFARESISEPPGAAIDIARHVVQALQRLPRFLQLAVASDPAFRAVMRLPVSGTVSLGSMASFDRDRFFETVEAAYAAPGMAQRLCAEDGIEWSLEALAGDGSWPLDFTADTQRMRLRGVYALHPDAAVRLTNFDQAVRVAGLPPEAVARTRRHLADRPLVATEIEALDEDLATTPAAVADAIGEAAATGQADLLTLVPAKVVYYERLTGAGRAANLESFVQDVAHAHVANLIDCDAVGGARWALLLGSHSLIPARTALASLDEEAFGALGTWVEERGDLLSMVTFVELALGRQTLSAKVTERVGRLATSMAGLDAEAPGSRFELFAALVVLVDGQLSRTGTLGGWAPFQRRAAAFAQAALIERHYLGKVDAHDFSDWCLSLRSQRFFMQNYVDLRTEPRWRPELIDPAQLKDEFLGRMMNAAAAARDKLQHVPTLADLFFGEGGKSFRAALRVPQAFCPGPLEGAATFPLAPTPEAAVGFQLERLSKEPFEAPSLYPLINQNGLFQFDERVISLAMERIETAGYRLIDGRSKAEVEAVLGGLAGIAASQRHVSLAAWLRAMCYRHRMQAAEDQRLSCKDELQTALVAAAAHETVDEWCAFLEPWVTSLAMQVDDVDDGEVLRSFLDDICSIMPAFRRAAARALASLDLTLPG